MGFFKDLFSKSEYIDQIVRYEIFQTDEGKKNNYITLKFEAYYNGQRVRCEYEVWIVPKYDDDDEGKDVWEDITPLFNAMTSMSPPEMKVRIKVRNEQIKEVHLDTDYLLEKTGIKDIDLLDYDGECLTD